MNKYLILLMLLYSCSKPTSEEVIVDEPILYLTNYKEITISVAGDLSAKWKAAVSLAITDWNKIGVIHFTLVSNTANVHIHYNDITNWAIGVLPAADRKPGDEIQINPTVVIPDQLMTAVIKHEIGHIIGLRDIRSRASIMNDKQMARDFTTEDIQLIKSLF